MARDENSKGGAVAVTYMTSADVARRAGVSSEMVRVWHRRDQLPADRTIRGMRLFRQDDVERFLRDRAARRGGGGTSGG